MKALFVKVNGPLTVDMMVGGLIDMGVPPVYLKASLKEIGETIDFIEEANPKAQVSAHYFYIPPQGKVFSSKGEILLAWQKLKKESESYWYQRDLKIFQALFSHVSDEKISGLRITKEKLVSLYLFMKGLDYLDAEAFFVVPFSIEEGASEEGKASFAILENAISTQGLPLSTDGMDPFAGAVLEGLSDDYMPMDGRFLVDKTSYGSNSVKRPTGDNTIALFLGYFTNRGDSIFGKRIQLF